MQKLLSESDYYWDGMYNDANKYVKACTICVQTHRNPIKKQKIKQIICNKPKERFIVDLCEIESDLITEECPYRYTCDIIDHFSKYCCSYPLLNKKAITVLGAIINFINAVGKPEIIQADNGKEFKNSHLIKYCHDNNITLLHSRPRHPNTNGAVEVFHKEIHKAIKAQKLELGNQFELNYAIQKAVYFHNNNTHRITKFKPVEILNTTDPHIIEQVKENISKSQINNNKNRTVIKNGTKVLVSDGYIKKGNKLVPKFGKIGNKTIPGIIKKYTIGNFYQIEISVNYEELEKGNIYEIEYNLIRVVNETIYNEIIESYNF